MELDRLYWTLLGANTLLLSVAYTHLCLGRSSRWVTGPGFPILLVLFLIVGRWPSLLIAGPLNPDESLMLAQAMKFAMDPMPWRAMDTGTGGPINSYALIPFHWLGFDWGYPLARVAATTCITIYVVSLFITMRLLSGPTFAATAVLPVVAFHALATNFDFLHYSSELVSLMLTGLMLCCIAGFWARSGDRRSDLRRGIAVGVLAAGIALSKLQALPLAALAGASFMVIVSSDVSSFVRRTAGLFLGFSGCLLMLLIILLVTGVFPDFMVSFINLPLSYVSTPLTATQFWLFLKTQPEAITFLSATAPLLALAAAANLLQGSRHGPHLFVRIVCALAIAIGGYVTLTSPGRMFQHYLNYLPLAATLMLFMLGPWRWKRTNA